MSDEDERDDYTSTEKSPTRSMLITDFRKNGHIVIKGRPCKIVDMYVPKEKSKPVHIAATNIFTNKKLEDVFKQSSSADAPDVSRREFNLVDIADGMLILTTEDGNTKDDVKLPEGELGEEIQTQFDDGKELIITVLSAMGEEAAVGWKEDPKK